MDTFTVLTFAAVLGVQVVGYVLFKSYRAAIDRVQREQDYRQTRPARDLGSFVGGHNQVGDN